MPYSTQDLIQILDEELRAHWKGERVLLSSSQRIDNPVIALMLGPEKLSKVFAYREFREQIHIYQRQHEVSGIIQRHCTFEGKTLEFPELHNQLVAIPGDKECLVAAKIPVLEFWNWAIADKKLWLAGPEPRQTTTAYVEELIQQAEWAELDVSRTELYLGLCWGNPEECHYQWSKPESGCNRIIATATEPNPIKVY
jgi:hypothetical protein